MDIKLSNNYALFVEGTQEDYLLFDGEEYEPLYRGIYNQKNQEALMICNQMKWLDYGVPFLLRGWRMESEGIKALYEISIV